MDRKAAVRSSGLLVVVWMLVASGSTPAFAGPLEKEPSEAAAAEPALASDSRTATAAADADLQGAFTELEAAWQMSQAEPGDTHLLGSFQRLMADFLNEAVNIHPESPWTLKGVELYGEWCLQTANRKSRRYRNHEAALRVLQTARDYFEMIDAEPGQELLEAITRMEQKVD